MTKTKSFALAVLFLSVFLADRATADGLTTPPTGTTFLYDDRTIYVEEGYPPALKREGLILPPNGYQARWRIRDDLFEEYLFCLGCTQGRFDEGAYAALWPLEVGRRVAFDRETSEGRRFRHEIVIKGTQTYVLEGIELEVFEIEARASELLGSWTAEGRYLFAPELGWLVDLEESIGGAVSRSAVLSAFRPPDLPLLPPVTTYPPFAYSPAADDPRLEPAPFQPAPSGTRTYLYDLATRAPLLYEIGQGDGVFWSWRLVDFHRIGTLMAPEERFVPFCPGCETGRLDEDDYLTLWPLEVGKSVEVDRVASNGQPWNYEIAVVGTDLIATPGETYQAYVVETRFREIGGASSGTASFWYAPDPGWIVEWREESPFVEPARSWRATHDLEPQTRPQGPDMAPGAFNPLPPGTRMTWTEPATGLTEFGVIDVSEGYRVYWTWFPAIEDEDPRDMDRFFFCMFCSNTQFPLDSYRSLWPLEVGKRIDYFRSNRWAVWSDSIEIIGTETLELPFGSVDTYVVHAQTRSMTSPWRAEEYVWFAPSLGWSVQFDYIDAQGRQSRWQAVSFDPPGTWTPSPLVLEELSPALLDLVE